MFIASRFREQICNNKKCIYISSNSPILSFQDRSLRSDFVDGAVQPIVFSVYLMLPPQVSHLVVIDVFGFFLHYV